MSPVEGSSTCCCCRFAPVSCTRRQHRRHRVNGGHASIYVRRTKPGRGGLVMACLLNELVTAELSRALRADVALQARSLDLAQRSRRVA